MSESERSRLTANTHLETGGVKTSYIATVRFPRRNTLLPAHSLPVDFGPNIGQGLGSKLVPLDAKGQSGWVSARGFVKSIFLPAGSLCRGLLLFLASEPSIPLT